jgi:hypothetical protein
MTSIRTQIGRTIRQSGFYWRYVQNLRPWLEYQLDGQPVTANQRETLRDLKRDGIAITTIEKLTGTTRLMDQLEAAVWKLERELSGDIARGRRQADATEFKAYIIDLLGARPVLDPNDIFVRVALQPMVLGLANSYFGMYTCLRFFNVWHTLPTSSAPRNSQLWHRDPEDRHILKMFIYLTDVDADAGPLVYAASTHPYGRVKAQPESFGEPGTTARRSTDEQMEAVLPRTRWVHAIGPKGTVIFADTRGYHKGGLVRGRERIMYNCMFTSQATTRAELFERTMPIPKYTDRPLAFALGIR